MKTHQEIIDAREAITEESIQAKSKIDAEKRLKYLALQDACAKVGHVFGKNVLNLFGPNDRMCMFCRAPEPVGKDGGYNTALSQQSNSVKSEYNPGINLNLGGENA